jgi:hypothetical protein
VISPLAAVGVTARKGGLALTRSLGDELAHLLLHFGGVALGAGDLAGLVFLDTHDAHKLFPAFAAEVFVGGHGIPPEHRSNILFHNNYNKFAGLLQGVPGGGRNNIRGAAMKNALVSEEQFQVPEGFPMAL